VLFLYALRDGCPARARRNSLGSFLRNAFVSAVREKEKISFVFKGFLRCEMRKCVLKVYLWTLAICVPYTIWLLITGKFIPCFYLTVFGKECGACGVSRMFLSMARLDFDSAFHFNPVMFVLFFFWNAVAIMLLTEKIKLVQNKIFLYSSLALTIAAVIIYGFVKNAN